MSNVAKSCLNHTHPISCATMAPVFPATTTAYVPVNTNSGIHFPLPSSSDSGSNVMLNASSVSNPSYPSPVIFKGGGSHSPPTFPTSPLKLDLTNIPTSDCLTVPTKICTSSSPCSDQEKKETVDLWCNHNSLPTLVFSPVSPPNATVKVSHGVNSSNSSTLRRRTTLYGIRSPIFSRNMQQKRQKKAFSKSLQTSDKSDELTSHYPMLSKANAALFSSLPAIATVSQAIPPTECKTSQTTLSVSSSQHRFNVIDSSRNPSLHTNTSVPISFMPVTSCSTNHVFNFPKSYVHLPAQSNSFCDPFGKSGVAHTSHCLHQNGPYGSINGKTPDTINQFFHMSQSFQQSVVNSQSTVNHSSSTSSNSSFERTCTTNSAISSDSIFHHSNQKNVRKRHLEEDYCGQRIDSQESSSANHTREMPVKNVDAFNFMDQVFMFKEGFDKCEKCHSVGVSSQVSRPSFCDQHSLPGNYFRQPCSASYIRHRSEIKTRNSRGVTNLYPYQCKEKREDIHEEGNTTSSSTSQNPTDEEDSNSETQEDEIEPGPSLVRQPKVLAACRKYNHQSMCKKGLNFEKRNANSHAKDMSLLMPTFKSISSLYHDNMIQDVLLSENMNLNNDDDILRMIHFLDKTSISPLCPPSIKSSTSNSSSDNEEEYDDDAILKSSLLMKYPDDLQCLTQGMAELDLDTIFTATPLFDNEGEDSASCAFPCFSSGCSLLYIAKLTLQRYLKDTVKLPMRELLIKLGMVAPIDSGQSWQSNKNDNADNSQSPISRRYASQTFAQNLQQSHIKFMNHGRIYSSPLDDLLRPYKLLWNEFICALFYEEVFQDPVIKNVLDDDFLSFLQPKLPSEEHNTENSYEKEDYDEVAKIFADFCNFDCSLREANMKWRAVSQTQGVDEAERRLAQACYDVQTSNTPCPGACNHFQENPISGNKSEKEIHFDKSSSKASQQTWKECSYSKKHQSGTKRGHSGVSVREENDLKERLLRDQTCICVDVFKQISNGSKEKTARQMQEYQLIDKCVGCGSEFARACLRCSALHNPHGQLYKLQNLGIQSGLLSNSTTSPISIGILASNESSQDPLGLATGKDRQHSKSLRGEKSQNSTHNRGNDDNQMSTQQIGNSKDSKETTQEKGSLSASALEACNAMGCTKNKSTSGKTAVSRRCAMTEGYGASPRDLASVTSKTPPIEVIPEEVSNSSDAQDGGSSNSPRVCDCCYCEIFGPTSNQPANLGVSGMMGKGSSQQRREQMKLKLRKRLENKKAQNGMMNGSSKSPNSISSTENSNNSNCISMESQHDIHPSCENYTATPNNPSSNPTMNQLITKTSSSGKKQKKRKKKSGLSVAQENSMITPSSEVRLSAKEFPLKSCDLSSDAKCQKLVSSKRKKTKPNGGGVNNVLQISDKSDDHASQPGDSPSSVPLHISTQEIEFDEMGRIQWTVNISTDDDLHLSSKVLAEIIAIPNVIYNSLHPRLLKAPTASTNHCGNNDRSSRSTGKTTSAVSPPTPTSSKTSSSVVHPTKAVAPKSKPSTVPCDNNGTSVSNSFVVDRPCQRLVLRKGDEAFADVPLVQWKQLASQFNNS